MSATISIRKASRQEIATAIEWAAQEGWNLGLQDLAVFHSVDPDGFLMGWIDGTPVSAISVVRYGDDFGFLGIYIVLPDHRGSGVGLQTWKAGMAHLQGRSIGLDGVVEQQDNYRQSGFAYVGCNVCYSGRVQLDLREDPALKIRPICADDLSEICALDCICFGKNCDAFIADWCLNSAAKTRQTLVFRAGESLFGFSTIRQCLNGCKIARLFCESDDVARHLPRCQQR